jgi:hypothetical protein
MVTSFWVVCAYLTLAVFATSSAYADWQYTRWGMTPEEVIEASQGEAGPSSNPRCMNEGKEPTLAAPFQTGEFVFEAIFCFKNNLLDWIVLVLADESKSSRLFSSMEGVYGKSSGSNHPFLVMTPTIHE